MSSKDTEIYISDDEGLCKCSFNIFKCLSFPTGLSAGLWALLYPPSFPFSAIFSLRHGRNIPESSVLVLPNRVTWVDLSLSLCPRAWMKGPVCSRARRLSAKPDWCSPLYSGYRGSAQTCSPENDREHTEPDEYWFKSICWKTLALIFKLRKVFYAKL